MRELENLKELYLDELRRINKKGELTAADGDAAKKALEGIQQILSISCEMDKEEKGYSEGRYNRSGNHMMRYSMGDRDHMMPDMRYDYNYSRHNSSMHMIGELEKMMDGEMDERRRRVIRNAIDELKMI